MGRIADSEIQVNFSSSIARQAPNFNGATGDFSISGLAEYVALGYGRISGRSGSALVVVHPEGVRVVAGDRGDAPGGGGRRGVIVGFSRASRRRLRRVCMATPWGDYAAEGKRSKRGRAFFLSLTYPADYPEVWEVWKGHRRAFEKRIGRQVPARFLWKLEFQKRGAPHFHGVILLEKLAAAAEVRRLVSDAWHEVVGTSDKWHGVYGAKAGVVYGSGRPLVAYMLKYLGKEWEAPGAVPEGGCGRVWGHSYDWPQRVLGAVYLTGRDYVELVRRVRKWGKRSRYLRGRKVRQSFDLLGRGVDLGQLLRGLECIGPDGVVFTPP